MNTLIMTSDTGKPSVRRVRQRASLLVLGHFAQPALARIEDAASRAAMSVEVDALPGSNSLLVGDRIPSVLLVDHADATAREACMEARADGRFAHVPMLAVARDIDELGFANVFSWGGDDLVASDRVEPLLQRLRSLVGREVPGSPPPRGIAIVADPDNGRRIVVARALRSAGYEIQFATRGKDVAEYVHGSAPALVVINAELDADVAALAAETSGDCQWIVTCPPRDESAYRDELDGLANAVAMDGYAPPENVVFRANELCRAPLDDRRASRRLLYGTTVAFRGAGRDADDFGYTYTVSEGGVFVRTLASPDEDTVWLELNPPRSSRRVRLEGRVAWRRPFGSSAAATAPPGFGVEITDGSAADRAAWAEGYRAFLEAFSVN